MPVILNRRNVLMLGASFAALGLAACSSSDNKSKSSAASGASNAKTGSTDKTAAAATGPSQADLMKPAGLADKMVFGPADAKVTVIEYASLTCPHCFRFNRDVFPKVKAKYIDTNKIRYILRPFPRDKIDFAMFMLAENATFSFHAVETFFSIQPQLFATKTPGDLVKKTALELGYTDKSYQDCLSNQTIQKNLQAELDQATNVFGIDGTPTFFFNGKKVPGELSIEEFSKEVDPLLS